LASRERYEPAAIEKAGEDDVEAAARAVAAGRSPPAPTIERVRGKVREDEEVFASRVSRVFKGRDIQPEVLRT
jgi:hypothetical protein